MKYFVKSLFVFMMFLLLTLESYAISWRYDLESALREAEKDKTPIMVDFYTDWCGWCKKLDQDTYSDKKVDEVSRRFICVKLNGDNNRDLAAKYNVRGYPTILFLDFKGNVKESVVGYRDPNGMAQAMESALKKVGGALRPAALAVKAVASKNGFQLGGIINDSKECKAIIDDTIVKAGDIIKGAKVVEITKKQVKLNLKGKDIILKME